MKLDTIDRSILKLMQENARISNVELAAKVGLSASSCLRRVQHLEASGLIRGYVALVDEEAAGYLSSVFVQITLDHQTERALHEFEEAVAACPGVMECYLMSGVSDYLVRVLVRDMRDYEYIHKEFLSRLPGVSRIQSSFALRPIIRRTAIDPVDESRPRPEISKSVRT